MTAVGAVDEVEIEEMMCLGHFYLAKSRWSWGENIFYLFVNAKKLS